MEHSLTIGFQSDQKSAEDLQNGILALMESNAEVMKNVSPVFTSLKNLSIPPNPNVVSFKDVKDLKIYGLGEGVSLKKDWVIPEPGLIKTEAYKAAYDCIRSWRIGVPEFYDGYCPASGHHVTAILQALKKVNVINFNIKGEC